MFRITLDKHAATWYWFTNNPQGGGFGSNHCGSKRVALAKALRGVPIGAQYVVTTNGSAAPAQYAQ